MKQNLIIFGNETAAQQAKFYFDTDSNYNVVAFTVDKAYIKSETFEGLPLHEFETIESRFPIENYYIFIAVGYTQMNAIREKKYYEAKEKGYNFASYISSRCLNLTQVPIGENAYILENTVIQPFAKIGNNVSILVGNGIGHNCTIEDHNFITSYVAVCGESIIRKSCFLGVGCIIADYVEIAEKTLVGAQSFISKNTEKGSVYVAPRAIKLDKNSSEMNL